MTRVAMIHEQGTNLRFKKLQASIIPRAQHRRQRAEREKQDEYIT